MVKYHMPLRSKIVHFKKIYEKTHGFYFNKKNFIKNEMRMCEQSEQIFLNNFILLYLFIYLFFKSK